MVRVVTSTSAAARIAAAAQLLDRLSPGGEALVVGASRGAADDFARGVTRGSAATFGISRFGLAELAARAAAVPMARSGHAPATEAAMEAIAARAVFDAEARGALTHLAPVADTPGFPRALARTLHELRLALVAPGQLTPLQGSPPDLAYLLETVGDELDRFGLDDRADLFRVATSEWASGRVRWCGLPVVLLDIPLDARVEQEFVAAVVSRADDVVATVPAGDRRSVDAWKALGFRVEVEADEVNEAPDLTHLRRYIFATDRPPERAPSGDVTLFSAPGEGREAVEIVRRILEEARRGAPFDEMAVLVRAPQHYVGLLEHACSRGGVPVYFERGTRRPDPAGRAFTALLSCAVEGLSAKRFDEYLSLGQVPRMVPAPFGDTAHDSAHTSLPPRDDLFSELATDQAADDPESAVLPPPVTDSDDEAIVAGTLRSPWKWEELVVESAVVGGRTRQEGKERWRRRLDGLSADYRLRIGELMGEEPDSPRVARYQRDLRNLAHLKHFALPIVDDLAEWPDRALWGEWLDRFSSLATRSLYRPARVLQTLGAFRPMSEVGPVSLEEARDVLKSRLIELDWDPPERRYGRVFVGTPHQARGRSFRVVFVPGLAERVVPQRPREDPLLLDAQRAGADRLLVRQDDRAAAERLLLRIAIGAASARLYLSYPRMDVAETRSRVPSFYALDVIRAMTGRVPDHRLLAADAEEEAGASLEWPAPGDADRAIDELEHDLAVLKPLLESRDAASVKGRAHYLLGLNEALRRSVIARWARGRSLWSPSDGLVKVTPEIKDAIDANRLGARAYSLSALQRFSACPYQFLLAAVHRLEPRDEPEPLLRMDPLTRGSLFHKVQAEFFRALQQSGALPVTSDGLLDAVRTLHGVLERVAAAYAEQLAPAIPRVWSDEIGELRRDLSIWVRRLADEPTWVPTYFEFSFGLHDEGRDPRSLREPVVVDGRFVLRGSVDLIEHRQDLDLLRVTDHKTGKDRSSRDLIVGGGAVLQPVLYSVAVERGLGKRVTDGRLFYCTTAGGFAEHTIPVNDYTKRQAVEVLEIIDRAVEQGFLVAAPAERACAWCDFRPVCGPREEDRVKRTNKAPITDLAALRSLR